MVAWSTRTVTRSWCCGLIKICEVCGGSCQVAMGEKKPREGCSGRAGAGGRLANHWRGGWAGQGKGRHAGESCVYDN